MQPIELEKQEQIIGGFSLADLGGASGISGLITSITNSITSLVSSITTVTLGVDKIKNSVSGSLKSDGLTITWDDNSSSDNNHHGGLIG